MGFSHFWNGYWLTLIILVFLLEGHFVSCSIWSICSNDCTPGSIPCQMPGGTGHCEQPCCSASSVSGGQDHWDDRSGLFIGLLVSGHLPSVLMRRLVTTKLSCETDCTDSLTMGHCWGVGLVVLDSWKGLEVCPAIPWKYLPESTLALACHCLPLHS